MASENKTRQEMIEMMYLVLTALLALNVSKEVVAAFITMDKKLSESGEVVKNANISVYETFDGKRAAIQAEKGDTKVIDFWQARAERLNLRTKQVIHHILGESNAVIEKAEKKDWAERDEDGYIYNLKSLMDVSAMDNFDIPTNVLVGSEAKKPNARGMAILDSIHAFRDEISNLMGTYQKGNKNYSFTPPEDITGLAEALSTANPEDTSAIAQFYRSMTLPRTMEVRNGGDVISLPWSSALFHHTPLVAAAALLTSLKVDVLNGENKASNYFLSKVDAPTFSFNKIEPLAFARTGYINAGDSLRLRVMIAAYDSTDIPPIRFGINNENPDSWTETTGSIPLDGRSPGSYKATGVIGVREKGELNWKPWSFDYTVGKPTGTVSLPDMNVLYRGYPNKVEGAASGYPDFNLSGGSNVTVSKSGTGYIASPGSGREAKINIAGVSEDGSSHTLGSFEFRVQNLPKPDLSLGRIANGESATSAEIRASTRLFAGYPPEIPLKAEFSVVNWEVTVSGIPGRATGNGAALQGEALRLINSAKAGSMIAIVASYKEPGGTVKRQNAVFKVK